MSAVGIIPARWASTRFPGKVATPIAGMSMLERVWRGACGSRRLRDVLVATDDLRIVRLCESFGARALMTSPQHATGTDRIAELASGLADEVIVNIQGDEPLIEGFVIDAAIEALFEHGEAPMATVAHRASGEQFADPNRVKVVRGASGSALYFSRAPIPASGEGGQPKSFLQHVGLYAYRREFLLRFVALERGEAERVERLEQLRALEHGHRIQVALIEGWRSVPVDLPEDVQRVEAALLERRDRGAGGARLAPDP